MQTFLESRDEILCSIFSLRVCVKIPCAFGNEMCQACAKVFLCVIVKLTKEDETKRRLSFVSDPSKTFFFSFSLLFGVEMKACSAVANFTFIHYVFS